MSHLKNKSEFNLEAARVLIDEYDNFAPSVHCSYFGCFQFIKSKLNKIGFSYEKIDSDISISRQSAARTLNSHDYPIKLILTEVEKKSDIIFRKGVKDKINLLKTYRVLSDYRNESVTMKKSKEALRLSKEIIKLINTKL
ncbi:hypothetical protein C7447_1011036 [Tenacibaculum adriaticum]|uniref:HEPN domain-containing protein n=1 Tax=Tenacibaculum adriaticum TaxID=413713 RepID=A0A5S5DX48_9FLAO|nr:hypothetical protein [Tenacibaculum adriaticum]TYQ00422.1 hypothetical protein C7447_1011036 [Tenacibaculum adriaticum]